jgi:rsbT co-antagonist protein RsbR
MDQLDAAALTSLAGPLRERRAGVVDRWVAAHQASRSFRAGLLSDAELHRQLDELVEPFLDGVEAGGGADAGWPAYAGFRDALVQLSASRARAGFRPSETAVSIFLLKDALLESLHDDAAGAEVRLQQFLALTKLVDDLGLVTFETFVASREAIVTAQAQELLELSTPVVKLWDKVLASPLIGTLDSARTQLVMETLLQGIVDERAEVAIIDITGVAAVDTLVAQHLLKTVVAARLMGAHCIISGIRPQIAQTIVTLGIQFGDIPTQATLAGALRMALDHVGVRLTTSDPAPGSATTTPGGA